jgi:hypothetical protein
MAVEKIINLKVNDDIKDTENNVVSLKRQLREAQQDVQTLADKFGATSREAVEAAKKAAELKDRIGDAKNLTDAFNPDAKFKALSASIGGVASGFAAYQGALGLAGVESKKLQEQLLQVQSAMALAQGLQGLGEARDSFKQLGAVAKSVFAGIKNAIGATGIGLLVIALGAIYAYWDDIKEAVNGVSSEQKRLNQLAEKNVQIANENLKSAKSMDNTLKLQGKSEQQILDIKIKATQASIDANIKRVKGLQLTNKLEEEAAQRNYERLKSFIDFVSIPQRILFENAAVAINKVIDLVNKIPGVEIKGRIDEKFVSKANDYMTKLAFDPEKTKAEGAATLKATQDAIKDLTNERDGYILTKNKQDTKASKDSKDTSKKDSEDAFSEERKLIEDKLKNDKISIDEKRNIVLEDNKLSKEDRKKFLLELQAEEIKQEEAHNKAIADLNKRYDDEKANRLADTAVKKEMLNYDRQVLEIENLAKTELEKQTLIEKLNGEHAVRLADATKTDNEKKLAEAKAFADQEIALDLAIKQAKRDALNTGLDILMQFAGKNKAVALSILAVQKGLAIADIVVNASKALAAGAANLATIPAVLPPGIPNPAFPLAVAATAKSALLTKLTAGTSIASILAAGISQAQSITGGGGGGGSASGGGGGSAAAPPSFNIVGQNSNNQLAQTIAGQQQQPVQAYVVSGNVSSAQSLDRNRIDTATFN